jgi:hypothetical protein
MAIKIAISDEDHDGICIATATRDGQPWVMFETTQAEARVLCLKAGGYAIPKDVADEAEAEEKRREALGRTWFEETIFHFEATYSAQELKEASA